MTENPYKSPQHSGKTEKRRTRVAAYLIIGAPLVLGISHTLWVEIQTANTYDSFLTPLVWLMAIGAYAMMLAGIVMILTSTIRSFFATRE